MAKSSKNSKGKFARTGRQVTLRHTRSEDTLTISHIIQNDSKKRRELFKDQAMRLLDTGVTVDQLNLLLARMLNQDVFKYDQGYIVTYFARCLCLKDKKKVR